MFLVYGIREQLTGPCATPKTTHRLGTPTLSRIERGQAIKILVLSDSSGSQSLSSPVALKRFTVVVKKSKMRDLHYLL